MNHRPARACRHEKGLGVAASTSLALFLLAAFALTLYRGWAVYSANSVWLIGDWLINYQGGFVRRGLAGELIFRLHQITGIAPALFAVAIGLICYACFFVCSYLLLRRRRALLPYSFLLVSPFLFLFQVHEAEGGFRKEVLFLALLAYNVWVAHAGDSNRFKRCFVLSLAVYPLIILSHEALVVYLPYMLIVYVYSAGRQPIPLRIVLLLLGISAVCLVLVLWNTGSATQVKAICDSLGAYAPTNCTGLGAVGALVFKADIAARFVTRFAEYRGYLPGYLFCLLMALAAYLPIVRGIRTVFAAKRVLVLWASSILGTVPLFVVALDWGRFLYIHLVSIFLVSLLSPPAAARDGDGRFGERIGDLIVTRWANSTAFRVTLLVALVGYATLWHLPHWYDPSPFPSNLARTAYGWTEEIVGKLWVRI